MCLRMVIFKMLIVDCTFCNLICLRHKFHGTEVFMISPLCSSAMNSNGNRLCVGKYHIQLQTTFESKLAQV